MESRSFAPARLAPRSLTGKLLASVLVLTTVVLAAMGVVFWSHGTVRDSMRELTKVAAPLDRAAHEMEINAIGTGLAVSAYLRTGDATQLVRLGDDTGDFRRASRTYERLADTPQEQRLGPRLRRLYEEFRALGTSMIRHRDARERSSRGLRRDQRAQRGPRARAARPG